MMRQGPADRILLLYSDRSDPVASIILDHRARFSLEVIAVSLRQIVDEVATGRHWSVEGRLIDPSRTAVVNRLTSLDIAIDGAATSSPFQNRMLCMWLRRELERFAYASSLPTVHSALGGYGGLLDQWLDLPEKIAGLRVPVHQTPWGGEQLRGDVYVVNPGNLYSLGAAISAKRDAQQGAGLAYVRPRGSLAHVAQVGRSFLIANAPPGITRQQIDYLESFARAIASLSADRILEHAFFIADDLPVFYATSPQPLLSSRLAVYADLVVQGLQDDLDTRSPSAAA